MIIDMFYNREQKLTKAKYFNWAGCDDQPTADLKGNVVPQKHKNTLNLLEALMGFISSTCCQLLKSVHTFNHSQAQKCQIILHPPLQASVETLQDAVDELHRDLSC